MAVASVGRILVGLAATRPARDALRKGRTPALRKRRNLALRRSKPESQSPAARNESFTLVDLALGVRRASLRRRPPAQPRRHARDDRDHNMRSGLDEDGSAVRALHGGHQDQARFANWKYPKSCWSTSSWITASRLLLAARRPSERNLELQPWDEAGEKDRIEACLSRAVCAGTITLDEARRRIWADWRAAGEVCQ